MLSTVTELAAYACFVVGAWMVTPVLGVFAAGAVLMLLAHALEGAKVPRVKLPRVRMPKVKLPKVTIRWPGADPEVSQP